MRHYTYVFLAIVLVGGLSAQTTPVVANNGTVNAASFAVGTPVAPGSLVAIFGTSLASGVASADSIPLSTSLGGATVVFQGSSGSFNAPLLFATDGTNGVGAQINAQIPWELTPAAGTTETVNVMVTVGGVQSAPAPVTITTAAPGIFAIGNNAVVTNLDGTLVWAPNTVAGISSHPAAPGDAIIMYANGLGPVDSPIKDGANSEDKLRNTVNMPAVLIGGVSAQVLFSGLNPAFVGLNQINVVVPNVPAGNAVPIQIQMNGITTASTLTIAISQ
jgi:uncharacterized protein (TIGR03437 family)